MVSASVTSQPSSSMATRTKRRICFSSSINRTLGPASSSGFLLQYRRHALCGRVKQTRRHLLRDFRRDQSAMRFDDGAADGQPKAGARLAGFSLAAHEHVEQRSSFGRESLPHVEYANLDDGRPGLAAISRVCLGEYLAAFSSRLQNTRSISTASNSSSGSLADSARAPDGPPGHSRAA